MRALLRSKPMERLGCLSFEPSKALSDEALGPMPTLGKQRGLLVGLMRDALTKSASARPSPAYSRICQNSVKSLEKNH